ncbi:ParA family protein [Acutalibacter sp. 1XD8-36]|uniref:ParA family protein n=1 Tax=Acutalibacter sp. 1XD8-36 TaxID=2320852 RepID=UPI001412B246|nr:AAA family ATPase [Acutalibacter sp. 1XD8-36]NBJ90859.1 ParA family protein [Acutalibacter sp. 1XD8-36]
MRTIAIANQKGGVAKTTSAHNLGAALAGLGMRVLAVDLDSQASLTISMGLEPLEMVKTMADVMKRDALPIRECIVHVRDGLDAAPSVIDLAAAEMELLSMTGRERVLDRALGPVRRDYDFILIDCPPQLSILTINALSCADGVIIPVKTDYLAYRGLTLLEDSVSEVRELINPKLEVLGVIATLFDTRVSDDRDILTLLQKEYRVLGVIRRRASAKKGIYDGLSVVEQEPGGIIAQEYMAIAEKLIEGVDGNG